MKVRVRRAVGSVIPVPITTEYIKLESFLKLANAAESGGMAKNFIQNEDQRNSNPKEKEASCGDQTLS